MVRDRFSGCFHGTPGQVDFALAHHSGFAQHDRGFELFCLMNQF